MQESNTLANQINPIKFTNEIYTKIEESTGINSNQIKATPTYPTMVMRKLISTQLLSFLLQSLLKLVVLKFIQMKCMILNDKLNVV
ncbi:unnamed protein product [Adineta steineri]|uniref:Uncharacterized protein n=2 Tax=Adineta steineri TaxID=433720 RepID=A0A819IF65_9BILA|nr:unnamed protein product [Adineta steineri]